jgi:hypothetical protein
MSRNDLEDLGRLLGGERRLGAQQASRVIQRNVK